ncbi:GntR family transcriptional regulator [Ignatzschineria sp. LJL83]
MTVKSFLHILTADNQSLPMYQKIKEHILDNIANNVWKPNQKLPSENEISAILNISRMTVNRAFKELTEEGYLFREKGAGTFVAEPFQLVPFFELMPISQELAIEGNPYACQILQLGKVTKNALTDDEIYDDIGQSFQYSEIIYYSNRAPIQYEKRYVVESFAPQYLLQNFERHCSTLYLQSLSPILTQKHTLEAVVPDQNLRQILEIGKSDACFKVTEKLLMKDKIVSVAEQYYPASRYQLHSKI